MTHFKYDKVIQVPFLSELVKWYRHLHEWRYKSQYWMDHLTDRQGF